MYECLPSELVVYVCARICVCTSMCVQRTRHAVPAIGLLRDVGVGAAFVVVVPREGIERTQRRPATAQLFLSQRQ